MINIEQNVRDICKKKGLKLSDVAERMGTGQSNLVYSLKGNPTISKLEDVAAAIQVSVSELLTMRPDSAQGIVFIEGQFYQLSKPSYSTVQLKSFCRFDILRKEIKSFINKSIKACEPVSIMGLVQTFEAFSLLYDPEVAKFYLSLCYSNGITHTITYDKMEYCIWVEGEKSNESTWDYPEIASAIINDIEGYVLMKLQVN